MPIAKRLTEAERTSKILGPKWRDAFHHPLVKKVTYSYDTSDANIMRALKVVRAWKGADWQDKAVIFAMASVLWRAYGYELLTDANFDRLRKHLVDHFQEILGEGIQGSIAAAHCAVFDEPKLRIFAKDDMLLPIPETVRKIKKRPKRDATKSTKKIKKRPLRRRPA